MKLTLILAAAIAAPALAFAAGGHDHGAMFDRLDADGDGAITQEEFATARQDRFARADANGDGKLTAEEIKASASQAREERIARRAERVVARLDSDGDGALSAEEFANAPRRGDGKKRFERMDANGDGVITRDELRRPRR